MSSRGFIILTGLFDLHFAYKGPERRLKALAKYGAGLELSPDDPMVIALETIVAARNRIAHPRSEESRFANDGELGPSTPVQRQNWSPAVPDVLQSMDQFLEAFGALDPETAGFFRAARLAYPARA